MANKHKKKRNKPYQGVDAANAKPVVTRITASNRSRLAQWWFDRKRILKPVLIAVGIILGVTILTFEFIRLASGN